jgi:ABC-2 type transport system permease protein
VNWALWKKAVSDAGWQLAISSAVLLVFSWIFVWLMSSFQVPAWQTLLGVLPKFVVPIIGVPLAELATRTGQLSILYVHLVTLLVCVGWALGRGSDSISGEIGRGTMDLILAMPVWRVTVMAIPAAVASAGAAVLVLSVWLGSLVGIACCHLGEPVSPARFLPGAANLWAMIFCLTAVTTLVSACGRDRWRTILWSGGFFVVSLVLEVIVRMWPQAWPLSYLTFLSLFHPQKLILLKDAGAWTLLRDDLALLGLGLLAYAAAGVVFWRRDIPTPHG